MNPTLYKNWLNALMHRPPQAEGLLKIDDNMCALGVLCDEARKLWPDRYHWAGDTFVEGRDEYTLLPPPSLLDWTEWTMTEPMTAFCVNLKLSVSLGERMTIQGLNDRVHMDLDDIAEFIDKFGLVR